MAGIQTNGEFCFDWPLKHHIVTAGPTYKDGTAHRALDLRAAIGTEVYAMADGVVETRFMAQAKSIPGTTSSYGNAIKIKHDGYKGQTLRTMYAHLSKMVVKVGDKVKAGQLIGYSGATGCCQGAHLHIEVWWGSIRSKNPLVWLDADFKPADDKVVLFLDGQHSVERDIPIKLKDIVVLQASEGDVKAISELANELGLKYNVV